MAITPEQASYELTKRDADAIADIEARFDRLVAGRHNNGEVWRLSLGTPRTGYDRWVRLNDFQLQLLRQKYPGWHIEQKQAWPGYEISLEFTPLEEFKRQNAHRQLWRTAKWVVGILICIALLLVLRR